MGTRQRQTKRRGFRVESKRKSIKVSPCCWFLLSCNISTRCLRKHSSFFSAQIRSEREKKRERRPLSISSSSSRTTKIIVMMKKEETLEGIRLSALIKLFSHTLSIPTFDPHLPFLPLYSLLQSRDSHLLSSCVTRTHSSVICSSSLDMTTRKAMTLMHRTATSHKASSRRRRRRHRGLINSKA